MPYDHEAHLREMANPSHWGDWLLADSDDLMVIQWAVEEIDRLREALVTARAEAAVHRFLVKSLRTALKIAEDQSHQ